MKWDGTYEVHTAVEVNGREYAVGELVGGEAGRELYALGKAWLHLEGRVYEPMREERREENITRNKEVEHGGGEE